VYLGRRLDSVRLSVRFHCPVDEHFARALKRNQGRLLIEEPALKPVIVRTGTPRRYFLSSSLFSTRSANASAVAVIVPRIVNPSAIVITSSVGPCLVSYRHGGIQIVGSHRVIKLPCSPLSSSHGGQHLLSSPVTTLHPNMLSTRSVLSYQIDCIIHSSDMRTLDVLAPN
jgi:hypothetical protein